MHDTVAFVKIDQAAEDGLCYLTENINADRTKVSRDTVKRAKFPSATEDSS